MTIVAEPAVERARDHRVLSAAGTAAIVFDLAVRSGPVSLSGALLAVVLAVGLAAGGRFANPQARAVLALVPVIGVFLALRAAPWLVTFNMLTVAVLLLVAAAYAHSGDLLDLRARAVTVRFGQTLVHHVSAPAFLAAAWPVHRGGRVAPVVRGLLLATPAVFVLGALLSSADAVFASFLSFDLGAWPEHAVLLVVGAWGAGGLLATAAAEPPRATDVRAPRLGTVEATVVLGSLVALYAVFAVAQLVALSEGGRRVIETAGLTYADYARSGFFQLLGVAALTLLVLAVLRACAGGDSRRLASLAVTAIALTLLIVVVALRRLHLYEQAFGLTVSRLLAIVFAVWVGGVFVLLAASWAGVGRGRSWVPASSSALALALLLVLNLADAEAVLVRRNVAHAQRTGQFDAGYLYELSDDAVPALADALPRLPPEARAAARDAICDPWRIVLAGDGLAGWNRSVRRADNVRRDVCGSRVSSDGAR